MKYLHTMVRVTDIEQSLHFYRDALGLKELSRKDYPQGRYTLVFLAAKRPAHLLPGYCRILPTSFRVASIEWISRGWEMRCLRSTIVLPELHTPRLRSPLMAWAGKIWLVQFKETANWTRGV